MTGFVDLETVNFGSFSAYSPLRPFCGKLDSTSDARLLGGFTVTTPLSTQVTISGGVFLNANLKYPSGFRTLKFTGSGNTLVGTIFQAFKVDIESPNIPLTLEMPQVAYPQNFGTLGQYDIILLEYQPKTGRFSFSSTAKGWIISSASPPILQIQTLIPHSGTYTLGYINSTEVYDVDLPVEYDAYFVVIPVQKQTNFSIIDDSFNAVFKAEEPFVVSMAKPTSLYPNPYGYKILFIVYVKVRDVQDGKSELQKMVLKKQSIKNSKWVYLEPSILGQAWNYTAGSTVVETIRNTTYASVETNKFGLWALMQPPVSACLKVTTGNVLVIAVGFWSVYAV